MISSNMIDTVDKQILLLFIIYFIFNLKPLYLIFLKHLFIWLAKPIVLVSLMGYTNNKIVKY